MRRLIVATCAAAYLLLTTGFANAAQGVCNCDDMSQIQQRIDLASAAIDAYTNQFLSTNTGTAFTMAGHDKVETAVAQAVNAASDGLGNPFVKSVPSDTSRWLCKIAIYDEGATECMKASLQTHESVHQNACERQWKWYRQWPTLDAFIKEEIDGYTAEHSFLLGERSRLLCSCPYYALRVTGLGMTQLQASGESVSGHADVNGSSSAPGVDVPLKIEGGHVSGEGSGTLNNQVTGTGMAQCSISSGEKITLSVDGEFTRPPATSLHFDLTGKPDKEKTQGVCSMPGKVVSIDQTSPTNAVTFAQDIYRLDTPASEDFPLAPGIAWTIRSELIVKEPWPQTKASNGRGSPVGDALHLIGMPDCST